MPSIWLELILIIDLERGVLLTLTQHAIPDDEEFYIIAHEAAKCILRGADDRFTAHIEAGVNEHWTAGLFFES